MSVGDPTAKFLQHPCEITASGIKTIIPGPRDIAPARGHSLSTYHAFYLDLATWNGVPLAT